MEKFFKDEQVSTNGDHEAFNDLLGIGDVTGHKAQNHLNDFGPDKTVSISESARFVPNAEILRQKGIKKIVVKSFKKLHDVSMNFESFNVLIGGNNSGKSSVLQALHFAVAVAQTVKIFGEEVRWGGDLFEMSIHPEKLIYAPTADVQALAHGEPLKNSKNGSKEKAISITIEAFDKNKCEIVIKKGRNGNIAISLKGEVLGERLMSMTLPFTVFAPGLSGIPREETLLSPGLVRRAVARGDANLVLRNILHMLHKQGATEKKDFLVKQENKIASEGGPEELGLDNENSSRLEEVGPFVDVWSKFLQEMSAIFPGITFSVSFDHENDEYIKVFFAQGKERGRPLDAAGTSILQVSQILAYALLFKPEILILDEPDAHLDANNQKRLCDVLNHLSFSQDFQVVLSTHSRHVLDAALSTPLSANLIWVNKGALVPGDHKDVAAGLLEMGALDSADFFAHGDKSRLRCLVATEDSSEKSIEALSAILESNGFRMNETEIRSYAGCTKADSAMLLCQFLGDKAPNVKVVVHRDRDYMPADMVANFESSSRKHGALPFVTKSSDIEGAFISPEHLSTINENLSIQDASDIIHCCLQATKTKSEEAIITHLTGHFNKQGLAGRFNPGILATECRELYEMDPRSNCRGKVMLGQVKEALQQKLGKEAVLFKPSVHLVDTSLEKIAQEIWPKKTK